MTMKRILQCTLICLVLVASGCGFLSDETSAPPAAKPSPSSTPREDRVNFTGAASDVQTAIARLTPPARTGSQSPLVKPVKDAIDAAIKELSTDDKQLKNCANCEEDTIKGAGDVLDKLTALSTRLGNDPQRKVAELDEGFRTELPGDLNDLVNKLNGLSHALPKSETQQKSGGTGGNIPPPADPWWWSTLILAAEVIGGVLILALLISAVVYLWKHSWKTLEANVGQLVRAHLVAAREAQPDPTTKLSSLASTQAEMNSKLSELDTEIRSLARLVRESLTTRRPDGNSSSSGMYQSRAEMSPRDEPEFPVSAVEYLGKMNRFANVVRPDFQNGILVNDPDGTGELVLIRDSRDETQPLFVVPRATQFHTKQDFYTYYQKYYDCPRPTAGDVWIIGPAVVEKVTGGWQLRDKGMLEIR